MIAYMRNPQELAENKLIFSKVSCYKMNKKWVFPTDNNNGLLENILFSFYLKF